jgi:hypothetical protein
MKQLQVSRASFTCKLKIALLQFDESLTDFVLQFDEAITNGHADLDSFQVLHADLRTLHFPCIIVHKEDKDQSTVEYSQS